MGCGHQVTGMTENAVGSFGKLVSWRTAGTLVHYPVGQWFVCYCLGAVVGEDTLQAEPAEKHGEERMVPEGRAAFRDPPSSADL